MENNKFILMRSTIPLFLFAASISFYNTTFAQPNLVSNGDMEAGGSPACEYLSGSIPNISNWVNANWFETGFPFGTVHEGGSFDWYDWNYAQSQSCTSGIWTNNALPPIVSNRWIGVYGNNFGERVRATLTYKLRKGNYTIKMKAAFTSSFSPPSADLKIRIHVSKFSEHWYADGVLSGNVLIRDITNFSLDRNRPDEWQQFETTINIPEDKDNEMQQLIIEPHYDNDYCYLYYDDVSLTVPDGNDCCPDHKLFQNTDQLPTLTEVNNYIKAGKNVDPNLDNGGSNVNPTLQGNVIVQSGQHVTFQANNQVILEPGFSTEPGAHFIAQNAECHNWDLYPYPIFTYVPNVWAGCPGIDKFCIPITGADHWEFRLFGSWGNENDPDSYDNEGFTNSGAIDGYYTCIWNGFFNGMVPNDATFVYTLTLTDNCGVKLFKYHTLHFLNSCDRIANSAINNNDSLTNAINNNSVLYIAPNPSYGKFQLTVSNFLFAKENTLQTFNVTVRNVLGEVVYNSSDQLISPSIQIDLSSQPKGIYFIKVQSEDKIYTEKVILH